MKYAIKQNNRFLRETIGEQIQWTDNVFEALLFQSKTLAITFSKQFNQPLEIVTIYLP